MNPGILLLKRDLKTVLRDPVLLMPLVAPALILLAVKFILPLIFDFVRPYINLDFLLGPLTNMLIQMPGYMLGVFLGLLILEDRDDGVLNYYSVTPLTREGVFIVRFLPGMVLSMVFHWIFEGVLGVSGIGNGLLWSLVIMLSVPLYTLILAAVAPSKLEGVAMMKLAALLLMGPFLTLIPGPAVELSGLLLPSYWLALRGGEHPFSTWAVLGYLGSTLVWLGLFLWLFVKRKS